MGAGAVYGSTPGLIKQFSWSDRFDRPYNAYLLGEGGTILLPREACPPGPEEFTDGPKVEFKLNFEPRNPDQARVVSESLALLSEGRSFILQASTGFGKTALTMPLIHHVGRKTLVVVSKSDLIRGSRKRPQWWEHIRDMLGVPESRIGIWRGDTVQTVGKDVVIAMLHSMGKPGRYPADTYRQFGMVVFDEVHRLPADQFSAAAFQFPARFRLGLSATPYRMDGRDRLIRAHLGPVGVVAKLVPMSPKVLRYHTAWRVPRRKGRQIPHSHTRNMHLIKILARNVQRNRLISHLIGVCRSKGRNLLVLSTLTDHLVTLADMALREGVQTSEMGFYVGELHGKKVRPNELELASVKPVVFATYGMVKEGTNCPWWDACILSTPKGNAAQTIGRILREFPDKKKPAVIDLVDSDSDVFTDWACNRNDYYTTRECGAEILDLDLPEGL